MRDIDDYSKEYDKADFEEYEVKFRRKKILKVISQNGLRNILEIGCGKEPLFKYLDEYDSYILVEPSKSFFDNALAENEKFEGREKRHFINDFFAANDETQGHKYDCVICSSLLHELEDPEELLASIRKVCSDNTLVHINVPNADSFHRVLAMRMGLIEDVHQFSDRNVKLQQHSVFALKDLVEIVESAGFEVVEKGGYFIKPFTHGQMLSMINNGIIDEKTLEGLDEMYKDIPELSAEIYVNVKKRV